MIARRLILRQQHQQPYTFHLGSIQMQHFVRIGRMASYGTSSYQLKIEPNVDYYGILGLQYGASDDQVKKAFYNLAKKYHPDTREDNNVSI